MTNENLGYKLEILTNYGNNNFYWCTWGYYCYENIAKDVASRMMDNNEKNVKDFRIEEIK